MDADQRDICAYLKSWAGQFVAAKEIARRAGGKRRFRKDPNWAVPALAQLVEQRIIESDATGHYRLRPQEKKSKHKKWVSPQIQGIIQKSGKDMGQTIEIADADDYPQI